MRIIEEKVRLSQSKLWELQYAAYQQFGISAWTEKGVPSYLTSNPLIARDFVKVIIGYFRDLIFEKIKGIKTKDELDQTIYLFDLGAGSGRLGYLILKELEAYEDFFEKSIRSLYSNFKICYVMADIVDKNIESWKGHPQLQPYIKAGKLDFAYYHHDMEEPIVLQNSGRVIERSNRRKQSKDVMLPDGGIPVVLICTYFFDTIPQDLFYVKNGELYEGLVTISVPDSANSDNSDEASDAKSQMSKDPNLIPVFEVNYDYQKVERPEVYYKNHLKWNSMIAEYIRDCEGGYFLFPTGSLKVLDYFAELSGGNLLLLAADQGVVTLEQVRHWGEPKISRHGTFSIAVSYHAIAKYFSLCQGKSFLTSDPDPAFVVMAGVLGICVETERAFRETLDAFEPVEYWRLVGVGDGTDYSIDNSIGYSIDQILLLIKLGNWDPINFYYFYPVIEKGIPSMTGDQKRRLKRVVEHVSEKFFPISSSEADFVMNLGVLMFLLEDYQAALRLFKRALSIGGPSLLLMRNIERAEAKIS